MTASVELRRVVAGDEASLYRAVNVLIDRDRGNIGSQIRLRGYDGERKLVVGSGGVPAGTSLSSSNYAIDAQSPIGAHAAFLLSATDPDDAPTIGNSALLVLDDGIWTGADVLAAGNLEWMSSTLFIMKFEHNLTAARTVTFQDLDGTVALLGAANAGHLLFFDNTWDIGAPAPSAARPRDVYIARNLYVGGSVISGGGVTANQARVYNSATISHTTSGSWQSVTFDSERYDPSAMHSTSVNPSRITALVAGVYDIKANLAFAPSAVGIRGLRLLLNGTTIIFQDVRVSSSATASTSIGAATDYQLAVNDYVEMQGFQDSGGALNMNAAANATPEFSMRLVG